MSADQAPSNPIRLRSARLEDSSRSRSLLVGLALAFLAATIFRDLFKIGNVSLYHFVAITCFGLIVMAHIRVSRIDAGRLRQNTVLIAIFVWFLLSPLWAGVAPDYLLFMGWLIFGLITCYISRALYLSAVGRVYVRMLALVFVALVMFAVFESITSIHLPSSRMIVDRFEGVPTATFWNQNDFAFYLVLFLGLTMSELKSKFARYLVVLATTFVLIRIDSTAAWLGFFTFFMAYLFIGKARYLSILVVLILAVSMVLGAQHLQTLQGVGRVQSYVALEGDPEIADWSVAQRVALIQTSWSSFISTGGLGLGAAGVRKSLRAAGSEIVTLHNLTLEILFNGGVPMFLLILLIYLRALWVLYRRSRHRRQSAQSRKLNTAIWASLISLPLASVGPAFTPYISPFWIWVGVVCGIYLRDSPGALNAYITYPSGSQTIVSKGSINQYQHEK